ncbi:carbohydrate-binding protein [Cohnella lupini]|uniref:Carbohydrate binding protein with CBM6 domain n=1 Tax=Cohnella lupini TaxID=1294267 RepID=A0A3D9IJF2_9BACL|nr:carbohydrate-binding protein [Cohnella lupini]RED61835.1 carbohydrate binding protein with CBM6 domain [Cohnella lupini]
MKTLSRIVVICLTAGCISLGIGAAPHSSADPSVTGASPQQVEQAVADDAPVSYEAEAVSNALTGNASASDCATCSGGKKIGGLYQGSSLRFVDITVPAGGQYDVMFTYLSGDPRGADIRVNEGSPVHYEFDKTADWDTPGTKTIRMTLAQGSNAIEISDGGGYAPDFDRIEIKPAKEGYEAEAAGNVLTGNAEVGDCGSCSGGKKVGNLYQGASLQFNHISAQDTGAYQMTVYYISGDPRSADITVNDGISQHIDFEKTVDWDTVGSMTMTVALNKGENTILFADGGQYSPDIDRIVIAPLESGYEAESSVNALVGNAKVAECGSCSGGMKVGNLYQGASLQFNGIQVPAAGSYTVTVHYISGDARAADVSVNGSVYQNILFPATADWNTTGTYSFAASLNAGNNTILFTDGGGYSPDIDKIVVTVNTDNAVQPCERADTAPPQPGKSVASKTIQSITVKQHSNAVIVDNGQLAVTVDLKSGMASYSWNGKTIATGVYSKIGDQASSCYGAHSFSMSDVKPIKDDFGKGITLKIVNKQDGQPDLNQVYSFYAGVPYFLTRTEASSSTPVSANYFAPLVTNTGGGVDVRVGADGRVLSVPYDNDMWIRHQAVPINSSDTSYEVSAVYDNTSRRGLIVGSITHDTWKTGIRFSGGDEKLNSLEVYGGASSAKTHDSQPHGTVNGARLLSPTVFVGFYDDYRTGMEAYGKANAVIAPPLEFGKHVPEGVPVGWNSWAAYESRLTFQDVIDTSNFIKNSLQKQGLTNDGTTYVNMDSYWDNLSDAQLAEAVATIKRNKQKAGIYWGPFVYWGDNMDQPVEGSTTYKYGDILLRDADGKLLPKLDGAYAVDPTHPGAKQRMDYYLKKFKKLGFEYIKLDFLTHGALEGRHFDPKVQTGTQAYNQGMAYVDELVADQMFISASIAPLFPSQYAHSRRIATDTFGSISDTEFQLNALTYGWWQNGTIYHYTDPDHMALSRAGSLTEARSRVNSAVISGTVFLDSDDVHNQQAQEYMKTLLTNKSVLALAKKGEAFRPVEGNTGAKAADAFILKDKNAYYLAVFNFGKTPIGKTVDLARAGLNGTAIYTATDLWTNTASTASGQLTVQLEGMESKLILLEPTKKNGH